MKIRQLTPLSPTLFTKKRTISQKSMSYQDVLPENRIFGWEDVGAFSKGQYMMMHSLIYRTDLLREVGLVLPEHTFYVDNIFVFTLYRL